MNRSQIYCPHIAVEKGSLVQHHALHLQICHVTIHDPDALYLGL